MLKLHRNLYLLRNFSKYKPYDCDAKFKSYSNSSSTENSGFIPVYKFPAVRVLSTINRLKLYQSGLTAVAIPTSIALNQLGILAQDGLHFTIGLAITGCITLYGVGHLTRNFIGYLYVNKESEEVKVAYLDFWGRRKDETFPISDVVPLSELPESSLDSFYHKFTRYSNKDVLKLNMRFGVIMDEDKFNRIMYQF